MSSLGIRRWGIVCVFVLAWTCCQLGNNRPTRAQEARQDATDAETARQQQIVERFLTVLERSPRRGTALDRVYGFHIENGTIDVLVKQFEDRTTKNPKDGTAWMILGLVESQRGRDAQAVRAFEHARGVQTDNPLASYYLGQSLILIGQPDKAVEAFEDAIAKKPAQTDLLAVFQALGRVHQQAQHVEQALAVWNRLEQLFPGDLRVQEDIASTLVEEGQFAEALPRYEVLARQSKDEYRKTVFRMQVADLKTKLNRGSEGVKDLEELLSTLNPQNWLYRDVRRHIEEVFLRSNDDDGLANYYKAWLEKNPEDVDAMARVARVLARQARVPEAQTWLDKALKLAPSRKELRLAFIDQLVDEQRYAEAAAQYAELDKSDPNNTDYLRNWGKLVLRDATRAQNDRQAEAEKIWRRMAAARANDPLVAAQVADLFRYAQMNDPALEFYQRAVELAPTAAQYREYLGEFYHILKRPDEALATWRKLSEGKQRTATNVARLAEVLAQFGYLEQALPEIAAACELDPKDFSLQLKAGELQIRGTKFDDALASLARGEKLAQNDEEREVVLAQRLKVYVQDGRLTEMAKSLREEIKAAKPSAEQWFLLARYEEELRNFPESAKAIGAAVELESANIRILTSAARIVEQSGELGEAAGLHRKLAVVDRRARSEHLQHVAQLESQLGRIDEALVAGRELLAAAPGNVDTHQFFADLCFRLGKPEEGLTALRRAVRANPSDQNIVLALASALAGQFRSDEAIELYWQAFDKATSLDDRLHVVGKLTELYLQINHFDRLLERLERNRQEADARREMTICLAQAHQSAGDYGMARQELERLLSENSRDTQLLQQLSKLAESEADLSSAAAFQEQVAKVAPGPEAEYRLATLLSRSGRSQEASEILVRLIAKEEDKEKMFRSIDSLLAAGEQETALHVIEPKLRENPSDWELLYREGVALAERSTTEAAARFEAILKLENLDDELGTVAKAREKAKNKQAGAQAQPTTRGANYTLPAFMRVDNAYEIQRATGLQPDRVIRSGNQMTVWTPQRFNQARMAALGWLMRFAQEAGKTEEFVEPRKSAIKSPDAKDRALWDWIYLQSVRADTDELMSAAQKVAARGSLAGQYVYLSQLNTRNAQSLRGAVEAKDSTPPLSAEELDLAVRAFEAVQRGIAGSEYPNISFVLMQQTQNIIAELKRAGRADEEQKLYERSLTEAKSSAELAGVLQLAAVRRDIESTLAVFDRFARRDLQELDSKSLAQYSRSNVPRTLCLAMGRKESAGKDVLAIVDRYLVYQAAKANAARKGTRSKTSATRSAQQNYIYIQLGGMGRNVSLPYPTANTYFDNSDLTVLRNAFEWFKQADLVSDFIKHLSDRQGAYASGEKVYGVLALAYTSAWNDDPDTATKALIAATGLEPQELELRLDLAQFCIQSNQLEEALAQLDAVAPSNQNALKERELLALDVAVRLGEMERARQAAQRLFGVRLDADTQIQLVGKMRRLGMNAEAEAIMARAQRQAGSQLSSLVALLTQYLSDGHMDLAAEVAHQVLRRSRTLPAGQQAMGYSTADGNARATALQCLAQTGKLKEIIARVEAQLERSPRSVQLVETLAEYYQAAGNMDKALELQKLLVEQRPNDGELRYRYAQSLARQNKHDEACEQYKLAIKRQPRLLENRSYEVVNTFQRAKKEAELGKFLGELEIKAIGSPNAVVNMISTLVRDKNQRDVGLVLLKKSWKAFPSQRQYLIQGLYDDELWKIPEVFEFGRESLLPVADAIRQSPWAGLQSVMSFSQNGHVNSVVEKILKAAAGGNQLPEFRDAVAKHLEEHPDWLGGKALLAVIDLGLKREVDVRAALAPLLEGGNDYRLQYARWVIGQEMEAYPEQRELTMQLYRAALQDRENVSNQFQYSPGPRLVQMYLAADRREEARKLLVDASREKLDQYQYDPAYQAYQRVENLTTLGKQFAGNDFPIDALRIYRELLTDSSLNDSSLQRYGRSIEQTRKEAEKQIELILRDLSGSALEGRILEMLTVQEDAPSDESSIDLLLSAKPAGNMALPKLDSLLATFISSATLDAPALGALTKHLTGAAQKRPRDLSIAIMQALIADKAGAPEDTQRTRERLASLMTSTPLEELPPNGRANARQRAAALRQVPLWLVAKQCLKHPESSKLGEQLAERAQAAAARQLDVNMAVAILNEQALESLEAGRAADAQRAWNEIVEVAIVRPRTKNTRRDAKGHEPPAPDRIAAKPLESVPLTLSQFRVGAALAQIAADKKQQALSLRAMREVVVGGLPVADLTTSKTSRPRQVIVQQRNSTSSMRNSADQAIIDELATSVWQISENWEAKKFPPEEVSTVLEQLVFPVGRPNEILLYEQPLEEDWLEARSVGGALAKWAVRAKRQEQIKKLCRPAQNNVLCIA